MNEKTQISKKCSNGKKKKKKKKKKKNHNKKLGQIERGIGATMTYGTLDARQTLFDSLFKTESIRHSL
jgi:hypothetical protein